MVLLVAWILNSGAKMSRLMAIRLIIFFITVWFYGSPVAQDKIIKGINFYAVPICLKQGIDQKGHKKITFHVKINCYFYIG